MTNRKLMTILALIITASMVRAEIPLPPVDAPEGFKWVLNKPYSDEFNGTGLDLGKWHDHYPGWEGRVPGKFVPSSVSMTNGFIAHTNGCRPMSLR